MVNTVIPTGTNIKEPNSDDPPWKIWKKRRYIVALLAFFGFFNVYALRANLSIAIVAMTEMKNYTLENQTVITKPEFDWSTKTQGYLLSSFFYGYITTQLIGGYLASRIGGKNMFCLGIGVTAGLTLITPFIAANVTVFLIVRVIEGVFEGITYPCMHVVWGKWAPPLERSRLATIGFSGSYFGTVVSMPVCSYLASTLGWPSIFYCFGTIGLIWCTIWMIVIKESPQEDPRISDSELKYITESLKYVDTNKAARIPWRSLATSMPVWAITVSHFSENWGFYTLLTELPKYMKYVLNFDMAHTGFMSALPYLAMFVMTPFAGQVADWFLVRGTLNTTQVRKLFNCSGFMAQTVFMLSAAYWFSPVGTTFCLTMAVGLGAFSSSGFSVNHLDIAPQYAGILFGFGNTFGTLPGIISPILTGHMVTDETNVEEWRIVFFVTSGVFLFGSVFYAVFASGELQPWAIEDARLKTSDTTSKTYDEPPSYVNKTFKQSDEVHT